MGHKNTSTQTRKPVKDKSAPDLSVNGEMKNLPHQAPHKIFLWNAEGVYVDCSFPDPVHGHFFGGTKVRGARLGDFFSPTVSQQILESLSEALSLQVRGDIAIEFERQGISYRADIQLFPMDRHVLGWVRDHRIPERKAPPRDEESPRLLTDTSSLTVILTKKEKKVAWAFGPGHSNRQIGECLQMSDRAVRFHIGNLLHKFHLPSRAHLAHLRLYQSNLIDD